MRSNDPSDVAFEVVTHYVYDKKTGEIIESHRRSFIAGRPRLSEADVERSVLSDAARRSGRSQAEFAVMAKQGIELLPGAVHRVDVDKKQLVHVQNPRHAPHP